MEFIPLSLNYSKLEAVVSDRESAACTAWDLGRLPYRYYSVAGMGGRQQLNILHPSCQKPALTVFPRKLGLPWPSFDYWFTWPPAVMLRLLQSGKRVLMLGGFWLLRSGVPTTDWVLGTAGTHRVWQDGSQDHLSLSKVMPALVRLQEQRHSKMSQCHFSPLDLFLVPHTSTAPWLGLLSKCLSRDEITAAPTSF